MTTDDSADEFFDGEEDDSFLFHLCEYRPQFVMLLGICLVFLALSAVSLLVVRPGTATYAVTLLNIAALLVFSALFGGMALLCKRM
ncbi:hypothetical protein [Haladaptatus sp. CMAA 1911]|uniref:hypothetical protein n=1 Tax=unclassified Haladaptatus TaxID=2622732 RepID=UPI00375437A7